MYQLLDNVLDVPLDQSEIISIQKGMNKVNISVREHVSEPSQAFLVTGSAGAGLSSYAVFYLLEPGVHLIYGFDGNPYGAESREEVEQAGVLFLEEMGAILEVVAWERMDDENRADWLGQNPLLAAKQAVPAELDDILAEAGMDVGDVQVIEEVEIVEEAEIIEETVETVDDDEVPEVDMEDDSVSSPEAAQAHEEALEGIITMPADPQEDADDTDAAGMKAADSEAGDESPGAEGSSPGDEGEDPLKTAFLKPEVKKAATRSRVKRVKASEVEAEMAAAEAEKKAETVTVQPAESEPDLTEPTETDAVDGDSESEEELFTEEELDRAEEEILFGRDNSYESGQNAGSSPEPPGKDGVETILRFLSKI